MPRFPGAPRLLARALRLAWPLSWDGGHAVNWRLEGKDLRVSHVTMPFLFRKQALVITCVCTLYCNLLFCAGSKTPRQSSPNALENRFCHLLHCLKVHRSENYWVSREWI